jgi:hypothetical protein
MFDGASKLNQSLVRVLVITTTKAVADDDLYKSVYMTLFIRVKQQKCVSKNPLAPCADPFLPPPKPWPILIPRETNK